MRIVYFIDHLRHDGTQRVLKQLVEGLSQRGHEQAIVCLDASWDDDLLAALRDTGARVLVLGRIPLVAGYGLLATWYWLRREKFDVAVTLLFIADMFARPLAWLAHVPRLVSSIRARNTNYSWWKLLAVRMTMRVVDRVIINSESVRDFAVAAEGAPRERTIYIPNGVQASAYGEPLSRTALRAQLDLPPDRLLIGSVGRLSYQKGFDLLLEAFAQIGREDVDLLLLGRGEEEPRLRAQAERLGIQARVHFAGYRQDVPKLLGALDVYVHPARWEGMSNALLEAMAAGCPIVASAVDGSRELIEDGEHGWLVPVEDVNRLSQALGAALCEPVEASRRGAVARTRATEHFDIETMVGAWERVLAGAD
jgi:glycosyltransferase involved in cell wall biosynthesis